MRQPTDDELDAIRDEIAWGHIEGDTYILPAIAEYVLKLSDRVEDLTEANDIHKDTVARLVAERDAALAEVERLMGAAIDLSTENKRLLAALDDAVNDWPARP